MKNNIKSILNKTPKSISTIIKDSGVGRSSFYEIMNGIQTPKITTAKKISEALERPITEVFPLLKEE